MRAPIDHPRRVALDNDVRHRLKLRSSLREAGKRASEDLPYIGLERFPAQIMIPNPWSYNTRNWKVTTNQDIKFDIAAILRAIYRQDATHVIYTDGSCTGGTTDGGAASVITIGPAEMPEEVEGCQAKGSRFTCSYDEEFRALNLALDWIAANRTEQDPKVTFCTDSLSLLQAIENLNPDTDEIRQKMESLEGSIDLMYVPGHKDVPGNELADKYAKDATKLPGQNDVGGVSMKAAKSIVNRSFKDPPSKHSIIKLSYDGMSDARDHAAVKSRIHGTLLAQLRSGHHKSLGYYRNFLDPTQSRSCDRCKEDCVDDVTH